MRVDRSEYANRTQYRHKLIYHKTSVDIKSLIQLTMGMGGWGGEGGGRERATQTDGKKMLQIETLRSDMNLQGVVESKKSVIALIKR